MKFDLRRCRSAFGLSFLLMLTGNALAQLPTERSAPENDAPRSVVSLDAETRREVVEEFAKALEDEYVFADSGAKMAQVIRNKLAVRAYEKIISPIDFALALQNDVRTVANDKHLRITYNGGDQDARNGSRPIFQPPRFQNGAVRQAKILPGNIGYMEVNANPALSDAKDAIAAAFAFLHNTDALILDLRGHGGGTEGTGLLYMNYLSEGPPYVVSRVRHRSGEVVERKTTDLGELSYGNKKPVFALISGRTFSGGEALAYNLQAFKRGTLVGESTGGGAHTTGPHPLQHNFLAFIPNGRGEHPITGTDWEGTGVKPDIEVPPQQALYEAQLLAVERLRSGAADPQARAGFEMLAEQLQARKKAGAGTAPNLLKPQQLVGRYIADRGQTPTVTQKGKQIFLQQPATAPAVRLIPLGADRYQMEGLSEDFAVSFREREGKIQMLAELSNWPPLLAEKYFE